MQLVRFRITDPVDIELNCLGIMAGMEFTGELRMNGAIYFDFFYTITNHCVIYSGGYEIITDLDVSTRIQYEPATLEVFDVESLFNPDEQDEILVIRVADLSYSQKVYLGI